MSVVSESMQVHWEALKPWFIVRNESDYDVAIEHLNQLLDEVKLNESHPLYDLLMVLGTVIHDYESKHYPIPTATGAEVLAHLMEEHALTQSDLPEVGSQGVVSELLNGKRELNVRQIRALAKRFGVSPSVFI